MAYLSNMVRCLLHHLFISDALTSVNFSVIFYNLICAFLAHLLVFFDFYIVWLSVSSYADVDFERLQCK